MFDAHAQKNILIVMLQIFDNLFHYKNIVTVQWIKRLKLGMVTMATLPPAKELKIQVVCWQNEIRTLDVLKSPTWMLGDVIHVRTCVYTRVLLKRITIIMQFSRIVTIDTFLNCSMMNV